MELSHTFKQQLNSVATWILGFSIIVLLVCGLIALLVVIPAVAVTLAVLSGIALIILALVEKGGDDPSDRSDRFY